MTSFNDRRAMSHQRYADMSDAKVSSDIREFHTKQAYPFVERFQKNSTLLTTLGPSELHQYIYSEVDFWPGLKGEVDISGSHDKLFSPALSRGRSAVHFKGNHPIEFGSIKELLRSTLCRKGAPVDELSRFYPSAGALYPIEVFLCRLSNHIVDWPDLGNVFRLRPNSLELESMESPLSPSALLTAICGQQPSLGQPDFAVVYTAFIDKFIFKYQYRGYRHCLMEVGSMYMLMDLKAKQLGLVNRVWSGFYDNLIADALCVDMDAVLPCVVQLFGAKDGY